VSQLVPLKWQTLTYLRASIILDRMRKVALSGVLEGLPYKVSGLRRRDLRSFLEGRQAALFCYGVGRAIGVEVSFALHEDADYDAVATYRIEDKQIFVPIQLKELVPEHVNPTAQLQDILDSLDRKLKDSKDLVVAIHINRNIADLRPSELQLPHNLGQLWLYGAKTPDQQTWILVGDLLLNPNNFIEFNYPLPQGLHWTHTGVGAYLQSHMYW
jgi:hypothetical protein